MHKTIVILLLLCLVGITYLIYFQQVYIPQKIVRCHETAARIEEARHQQVITTPTELDTILYLKNVLYCVAD